MKMMGYWMCFAFLAAVQVAPSMQCCDITVEEECETDESFGSLTIEEEESVHRPPCPNLIRNGNCGECGVSPAGSSTIINGEIVEPPNRFPWMASLSINGQRSCGASIISEQFVMTASHCVMKEGIIEKVDGNTCVLENSETGPCYYNPDEVKISFLTDTYEMTDGQGVAEIIPHPDYQPDKQSVENDIAIIRMSDIIQCGDYAIPICLPSPTMQLEVGMLVAIAGWGDTKDPNGKGEELRATNIEVEDFNSCKPIAGFNADASICLSGKGVSSACFGDSGGPGFTQKENKFYALGVASAHGSEECETSAPVVYTSVINYVEWIKEVSGVDFED